jgi:ribosomal protein S18 acetylase RimI-like enzyme
VDAENAGAIRVYERFGYQPIGKEEDYYGRGRAALIYEKPLAGVSDAVKL